MTEDCVISGSVFSSYYILLFSMQSNIYLHFQQNENFIHIMLIQFTRQYPSTNRTNLNTHPSHRRIKTRQVNLIHLDKQRDSKLRHKLQRKPLINHGFPASSACEYNPLQQVSDNRGVKHCQVLSALFPRPPRTETPSFPRRCVSLLLLPCDNSIPRARKIS